MKLRIGLLVAAAAAAVAAVVAPAGAQAAPMTIVAVGDVACPPGAQVTEALCRHESVASLVGRLDPDQLWLAGDLQYPHGEAEGFRDSFDRSFGRFKRISRPVPGNHEYFTPGAAGYFGYFGRRAGDPRRGYYSFDAGGWHVVALNTNCEQVACGRASRQLRWLKRDLRSNPNRCVAAIWHHPLFSSGLHGPDSRVKPFWRALTRARAEFAVTGHDHHFEAFLPQAANGVLRPRTGMVEYVVGTGGRSLYPTPDERSNSERIVQGSFGALKLDLGRKGWKWRFVDEHGATRASGRGSCR